MQKAASGGSCSAAAATSIIPPGQVPAAAGGRGEGRGRREATARTQGEVDARAGAEDGDREARREEPPSPRVGRRGAGVGRSHRGSQDGARRIDARTAREERRDERRHVGTDALDRGRDGVDRRGGEREDRPARARSLDRPGARGGAVPEVVLHERGHRRAGRGEAERQHRRLDRPLHLGGGREALHRIGRPRANDELRDQRRHLRSGPLRSGGTPVPAPDRRHRLREGRADPPHVGVAIDPLSVRPGLARPRDVRPVAVPRPGLHEAEVDHPRRAVRRHHDALRGDVAVDDVEEPPVPVAEQVRGVEAGAGVGEDPEHDRGGDRPSFFTCSAARRSARVSPSTHSLARKSVPRRPSRARAPARRSGARPRWRA